ncbi:hypothetical protein ACLOJK_032965 [Asimina triloba]
MEVVHGKITLRLWQIPGRGGMTRCELGSLFHCCHGFFVNIEDDHDDQTPKWDFSTRFNGFVLGLMESWLEAGTTAITCGNGFSVSSKGRHGRRWGRRAGAAPSISGFFLVSSDE